MLLQAFGEWYVLFLGGCGPLDHGTGGSKRLHLLRIEVRLVGGWREIFYVVGRVDLRLWWRDRTWIDW